VKIDDMDHLRQKQTDIQLNV